MSAMPSSIAKAVIMTARSLALLAVLALSGLAAPHAAAAGQKILTLLSSGDAEAQAFSLILANEARGAGHAVDLVLCGAAGDIALKTAPAAAMRPVTPTGLSVRALLDKLVGQGGKVELCAIYLPNRQLKPDALMDGVAVGKPAEVAARMADAAVKVVSP
mgnify:CR=1 FL=1|jgi:predicted peroxiredoxin